MHAFLEDKQALELAWIGMHQSQGVGKGWGEGIRAGGGGGGGGLYLEGRFNGGFFTLPVWRAYIKFGGAYFRNFTVCQS